MANIRFPCKSFKIAFHSFTTFQEAGSETSDVHASEQMDIDADYIIDNDGNIQDLYDKVAFILDSQKK